MNHRLPRHREPPAPAPGRRPVLATLGVVALAPLVLAGCASLRDVSSDVSTFGEWPAGRAPGTYAFERLPSQQQRAADMDVLEAAARPALAKAGFKPAEAGQQPDVLVQLGARTSRSDRYSPWDDPLWFRGGFGYWRYGPWMGPSWALSARYDVQRYEREVALLVRDRASGKPLYEARASNEGSTSPGSDTMAAMFAAALIDFPKTGLNPRRVTVPLPGAAAAAK